MLMFGSKRCHSLLKLVCLSRSTCILWVADGHLLMYTHPRYLKAFLKTFRESLHLVRLARFSYAWIYFCK